jgi:glycosyltransferase involved in cell wall biosynthesis
MSILLSVLTPAVPSRWAQLQKLSDELARQIGDKPVEHLVLMDNKRRTVGEKRDALLRASRGQYVAYCDDDDWVRDGYVDEILRAIQFNPGVDVVTFEQEAFVNGARGRIQFRLGNPNKPFEPVTVASYGGFEDDGDKPITLRNAWHVCAWRRGLAVQSFFPATSYGEDWQYASRLCAAAKTSVHIPRILHEYHHSSATTEAPPPP